MQGWVAGTYHSCGTMMLMQGAQNYLITHDLPWLWRPPWQAGKKSPPTKHINVIFPGALNPLLWWTVLSIAGHLASPWSLPTRCLPKCDNQRHLQVLPSVPWEVKMPWLRTTVLRYIWKYIQVYFPLYWILHNCSLNRHINLYYHQHIISLISKYPCQNLITCTNLNLSSKMNH